MNILVLGGTRFIGPMVVRHLAAAGHAVTVFHRGRTEANLPASVAHLHGDRARLLDFRDAFARLRPEVVLDLHAMTERDAQIAVAAVEGLARRVVVVSSQDVYRVYDRLLRRDAGPPAPAPFAEDAPLRRHLYPYRALAPSEDHLFYHYDKILVERVYQSVPALPAFTKSCRRRVNARRGAGVKSQDRFIRSGTGARCIKMGATGRNQHRPAPYLVTKRRRRAAIRKKGPRALRPSSSPGSLA